VVACRANLIFTPRDHTNGYFISYFHELMPYHKLDRHPEQKTPTPDKLHEQSDFLRSCRMVRLDDSGLPHPLLLRWMLKNLACFGNLQTLQLSRPEGRLDALLPVLNEWLGEVAAKKSGMPPELLRLSLCRWPGIDFKAVAGLLSGTPSLQSLDLIECDLQDDALREHIGPAVGKMTIPFDLYLDGNPITDDGLMQALGEGWLALDRLSLATCEKLTTGLHARLREVRRNLLPNLRHISLYMTALTPEDARAYLMQHIGGAYFKAAE
jgi:hypothetical protein